jgi:hypothetical protein
VAVQWLNQALCFYQSLCLVDSEVLRNRHLRVAANRYQKPVDDKKLRTELTLNIPNPTRPTAHFSTFPFFATATGNRTKNVKELKFSNRTPTPQFFSSQYLK